MSNILISTMPEPGHVNPMLPLATELVRRGHAVRWHTGPAMQARVEAVGASFVPFAHTPDMNQLKVVPDPGTKGLAAGISIMRRLFMDRVAGQVADYEEILADFPADLLLVDMISFGAHTFRDLGGPPFVTLGINPLTTFDPEIPPYGSGKPPTTSIFGQLGNRLSHFMARHLFLNKVTDQLNVERRKLALEPLPKGVMFSDLQQSPFAHIMPTTLAFEYPRKALAPQIHFVGPLLPAPPKNFMPPDWWNDLDGRKVVHVTQGTYATDPLSLIRPTVDGLADEDVLVVVTTRKADALGTLPINVRVAPFIDHAHLLPKTAAMVTNAGYNGTLTALSRGVPLVAAGQSEDKAEVSARIAWSGAGIDLKTSTPAPAQVKEAVRCILADSGYRRNAQRIATDFASHDGPAEAASIVEAVAETQTPVFCDRRP
jgi:UDP:flavonoid glycosyltransferase YjiC (YdhE family)